MTPPSFRRVLRAPGAPRLVLSSLVGRLPITFLSLSTVLLVREHTGSFAVAGLVAAAEAAGVSLATPFQGRLIDRHGLPAILLPAALANALGISALLAAALAGAPAVVLAACGLVAGAFLPSLGAAMRAMWSAIVEPDGLLETAYAVEAVLVEVMFVAGPTLATAVFALASPAAALGLAAVLGLLGTLAFATAPPARAWRGRRESHVTGWALSAPGMRTLVASDGFIGVAFGAVEVAVAAFAREHGATALAGVLLAAMAIGSMAGGVWYGARSWDGPAVPRLLALIGLLTLGLAPLALAGSVAVMAVLLFAAGLAIAPSTACVYRLVDDLAPRGMLTEAFTWVSTTTMVGIALGSAVAGPVVESAGTRAGLAIPCAAVLVSGAIALAGRRSLVRAEAMVRHA